MKSYETEPRDEVDATEHPLVNTEDIEQEEDYAVAQQAGSAERAQKPGFSKPSREQLLTWIAFGAVILLGAVLRFWGLGDKPLHHDESLHAYFSWQLLLDMGNWLGCYTGQITCYRYDPLLHGPFQFHIIALTYKIAQIVGAADNGINTTTVRIPAATLGTVIVGLPYFLRGYLGKWGAWLASFLLAVSPSMVYFSRFAREDIYMACFTLLLVIGVVRYVQSRQMRWLLLAAAAFSLSYATSEATFLTIAIFGSFLAGLIVWELGLRVPVRSRFNQGRVPWYIPRTAAPLFLLAYVIIGGLAAKMFLSVLQYLAVYSTNPQTQPIANQFVENLKATTVAIVPWLGIALGVFVLTILWREMSGKLPYAGRRGLAAKIDPKRQRMLDTILTMPWTHWFFAILIGWAIFLVLFTVLFTNIKGGIGDGIWQGLYYWLQQQEVARGSQPWYYYLILIPLYEQIGLVFAIVGIIRCLLRPTRFRIFLVYWFTGNFFLYSWAGEKMPWLMIFMTMPMMLLAAVGLEPAVVTVANIIKSRFTPSTAVQKEAVKVEAERRQDDGEIVFAPLPAATKPRKAGVSMGAGAAAIFGVVMAVLLLLPTVHNMYEVSYVHAADGPHEMMVYVQTTYDVNTVMAKIDQLDQKLYGGKHLLPIGIMNDAVWPFAWYVRDYPNICFNYPTGCPLPANEYPVIIVGGDNLYSAELQYGGPKGSYLFHQYNMRTWWDEGYKPPPCVPSKANNNCAGQPAWGGVGPLLWLSYGDNPPPNATFNLGLAVQHIWNWWWYRDAIGSTDGAYPMGLFIKKGLGEAP